MSKNIDTDYKRVVSNGEVISKKNSHHWSIDCDCSKDAPLANPRDIVVEYDGCTYHFYHSTPVFTSFGNYIRLDSGGSKTKSTKRRINNELPKGYKLKQRDNEWIVETPDDRLLFKDGMVIQLA